jgi:hypothetical protein
MQLLPYETQELRRIFGDRRPLEYKDPTKRPLRRKQVNVSELWRTTKLQLLQASYCRSSLLFRACSLQQRAELKGSFANSTNAQQPDGHTKHLFPKSGEVSAGASLSRRCLEDYQCAWGQRFGWQRQHSRIGRQSFLPTHRIPPATLPALVLAVRGPHWLRVHQFAPEIRDSRTFRLHRFYIAYRLKISIWPVRRELTRPASPRGEMCVC